MTHGDSQLIAVLGPGNKFDEQVADAIEDGATDMEASQVDVDSTSLVGVGATVQAVLEELDDGIADHLADTSAAHAASAVSFTAGGTIDATNVQTAVAEVATDYVTAISTHAGLDLAAAVHGFKGIGKHLADGITEQVLVNEIQTMDLGGGDPVSNNDTYKIALGAGGANKTALLTYTDAAVGVTHAAEIQAAIRLVAGYEAATCVAADANTFTITLVGVANPDQAQVTDTTGFTPDTPDATGFATNTPYVAAALTIVVTGLAVGDSLAPVLVYATKAAITTQVLRAASDFTVGAGQVTVAANYVNNTNNQYLFEWVDLT